MAVLEQHTLADADKFVQEVFWRSYWKGWLEMRPQVWRTYRQSIDSMYNDENWLKRLEEVTGGHSGIDCIDHWCDELVRTGYLHNHARMWFASIWIFTLKLPWQLGADYFMRHLLDGDAASNTLSWRWVAGLHTQGKCYLARADNIARFTNDRFNPSHQLAGHAEPIGEEIEFERQALPALPDKVPTGRTGLLLTDDDLDFQSLFVDLPLESAAGFSARSQSSPGEVSVLVTHFSDNLVKEALINCDTKEQRPGAAASLVFNTVDQVVEWAVARCLDAVVCAYIPVGENRDALQSLEVKLQSAGIELIMIRKQWDETVWPHAGKGFFALKKKIPSLLDALIPGQARQQALF